MIEIIQIAGKPFGKQDNCIYISKMLQTAHEQIIIHAYISPLIKVCGLEIGQHASNKPYLVYVAQSDIEYRELYRETSTQLEFYISLFWLLPFPHVLCELLFFFCIFSLAESFFRLRKRFTSMPIFCISLSIRNPLSTLTLFPTEKV